MDVNTTTSFPFKKLSNEECKQYMRKEGALDVINKATWQGNVHAHCLNHRPRQGQQTLRRWRLMKLYLTPQKPALPEYH